MTARGGRDAIDGVEAHSDGTRVLKGRAAAEHGRADGGVRRLAARATRLPGSAVQLRTAAWVKTFSIAGDARALAAGLAALTGRNP